MRATNAVPNARPSAGYCLIVDDEPRLRQVLSQLMRSDGFRCARRRRTGARRSRAASGSQATLVLSDLHMPEMDGIELLREIARALSGHRRRS